ncbi:hypothetical protein GCM10009846_07280 [Agrococcus versicolor]|uniref:Uncharacterized protein n=2 Tax=Agrococcus versicolor TaxID=501482 RepID=A0ABN3ALX6_9MICO
MLTTLLRAAPSFDPDSVTPGVIGFVATAVIAIAVCFLLFDMNRRVRRVKYREEARADIAAELAAGQPGSPASGAQAPGAQAAGSAGGSTLPAAADERGDEPR